MEGLFNRRRDSKYSREMTARLYNSESSTKTSSLFSREHLRY